MNVSKYVSKYVCFWITSTRIQNWCQHSYGNCDTLLAHTGRQCLLLVLHVNADWATQCRRQQFIYIVHYHEELQGQASMQLCPLRWRVLRVHATVQAMPPRTHDHRDTTHSMQGQSSMHSSIRAPPAFNVNRRWPLSEIHHKNSIKRFLL